VTVGGGDGGATVTVTVGGGGCGYGLHPIKARMNTRTTVITANLFMIPSYSSIFNSLKELIALNKIFGDIMFHFL